MGNKMRYWPTRVCIACEEEKELQLFKASSSGYSYTCNLCRQLKAKLKKYNITIEKFNEMFLEQKGLCGICKCSPGKYHLSIDHDHSCCPGKGSCGKCVRGFLCPACNTRLEFIENGWLQEAQAYLERYRLARFQS